MGKSSETFNKKEKEKKRLKKQQEKREKADVRKANSSKGKGLDDMMAYIDENGNITSTPPVAGGKQRYVNADDIQLGVPKRSDEPLDQVQSGIITFFNSAKGFGFIKQSNSQDNIFFHVNQLSFQAKENDKVTFETERGPKGMNAIKVEKAK